MKIMRAYKTELDPNNVQRTVLLRHAGTARFAYNWGLALRKEEYERMGTSSNAIELHRQLNALKKTKFAWMYEVSKCAPQEALRDLDRAYKNFFEGRAEYPKFKRRRLGAGSFRLTGSIRVFCHSVQLPRLGVVRLKEEGYLPIGGVHVLSATVSEKAGKWFVSLQVQDEIEVPNNTGPVAGVDLGISKLATISDGSIITNPKPLSRLERKNKRIQRSLVRKVKGSNNRTKTVIRLARHELRIANIRKDAQHKATTMMARTKSVIGVESLNVAGLLKNHHLAKQLADAGIGELLRQLEYKTTWNGGAVVEADPFFPSTKRCSQCGIVKDEMPLSERTYRCGSCGFEVDRDLNAAMNLSFSRRQLGGDRKRLREWRGSCHKRQVLHDEAGTEHCLGGRPEWVSFGQRLRPEPTHARQRLSKGSMLQS